MWPSQFDHFLHATIGRERNGMDLSVLSLLARVGHDPWAEAARLAGLPRAAAADSLAATMACLPGEGQARANAWSVALCLVPLLSGKNHPVPSTWGGEMPISASVLLVEDDALVRQCLREVLDETGVRVSDAASAAEALEWMAAEGVPDVLVTDLQLGSGPSGLALIAAARQRWPGVRAVLISGTAIEDPALDPGDRFLRKPFDVDALARAMSELIGSRPPTLHGMEV